MSVVSKTSTIRDHQDIESVVFKVSVDTIVKTTIKMSVVSKTSTIRDHQDIE